jgi:hypothetical protein
MRGLALVVIAVALNACAEHHVPPQRIISTSWSTVRALAPGTDVGVALDSPGSPRNDEVRYGRVRDVTDSTLTIRERQGAGVIPRDRIARLAVRTAAGTSRAPNVIKWSLVGAAIMGVLAGVAGSIEENPRDDGGKWLLFFGSVAAGAAIGSQQTPVQRFREQIIYIRP